MSVWVLTRLTFREAVRRKIALAAALLGVAFLAVYSIGLHYMKIPIGAESTFDRIGENALYSFALMAGLYTVNFLMIAMSALVSADTLSGEISSGSIQAIVTKPLQRSSVVLGKWLGFAALLGLYLLLMAGGLILSTWVQTGYLPPRIPTGLALMYLESLAVLSITLAASSRFSTLATGATVFGLYGLAFIGSWVEQIGSFLNNPVTLNIGVISSLIMPSEAIWRRASYEMTSPLVQVFAGGPFTSRSVPSVLMVAYGVVYLAAMLFLAVRLFTSRDL